MTEFTAESYMRGALDALRAGNNTDAAQHMMAALGLLGVVERVERAPHSEDKRPTALLDSDRANFNTLMDAAANDDVLLLHAREKATGHGHALICIKSIVPFHEDVDVIPVARMLDEDPTETYVNPTED